MRSIGETVTAQCYIFDYELDGRERCVAHPGDRGTVEYVDDAGVPTVRWIRSGRAIDCAEGDIDG